MFDASCVGQVVDAEKVVGNWNRWLIDNLGSGAPLTSPLNREDQSSDGPLPRNRRSSRPVRSSERPTRRLTQS